MMLMYATGQYFGFSQKIQRQLCGQEQKNRPGDRPFQKNWRIGQKNQKTTGSNNFLDSPRKRPLCF